MSRLKIGCNPAKQSCVTGLHQASSALSDAIEHKYADLSLKKMQY